MKRIIIFFCALLVVGATVAVVAAAFGEFSFSEKAPKLNKDSTIVQAADFYAYAVELTKKEKDMKIEAVTTITFKDFQCPSENLKNMILDYLGYKVGSQETRTASYSVNGGKDITGRTPFDIIQPAGAYIEKGDYSGLSLNYILKDKEHTAVSFTLDEESADYFKVAEAFEKNGADLSLLAPRHFNYIDVDGIVFYIRDMLDLNLSSQDVEHAVAEIEAAEISLGKSEITALVNDDMLLTDVSITVPVYFDSSVRVLNNNKNITARLEITQHYTINYNEKTK